MRISRRRLLQAACCAPFVVRAQGPSRQLMKRDMGRLHFEATTLGLGGQASLQWTPPGVDPTRIILKAFHLGLNYFDTSNVYGPSQMNYGKAFRELHLIPGEAGYDERLRESIFLTSKTMLRWAKGATVRANVRSATNGPAGSGAVDDVKRTLSLVFGDGKGNYPKGAYLNMVLCHALATLEEVEVLYMGLDKTDPKAEQIGTLAALRDLRDGTNLTGLNPKEEVLIRHAGFSGHNSPPVMMEMIQRDTNNLLDGMLVAINANDRLHFNMQYNVIPVAAARKMGLIAMKTFADGSMYGKPPMFSNNPSHVIRTVGSASLPSQPLVEYTLTTPGIGTVIIGTGQIDDDPGKCQMEQNLIAAQIAANGLTVTDRRAIEKTTAGVQGGKTNYFQLPPGELTPPRDAAVEQSSSGGKRMVKLTWQTAYAGDEPISHYEMVRDGAAIGRVAHRPQTDKTPFSFEDEGAGSGTLRYAIATVDAVGRRAVRENLAA